MKKKIAAALRKIANRLSPEYIFPESKINIPVEYEVKKLSAGFIISELELHRREESITYGYTTRERLECSDRECLEECILREIRKYGAIAYERERRYYPIEDVITAELIVGIKKGN